MGRGAMTEEERDSLLVVAAVITAVTFQAGVSPPGGVWQKDDKDKGRKAGCAVYSSEIEAFKAFLSFNTLALSTSILILICLTVTPKFKFRFEVWAATSSMFATYACSIFAIAHGTSVSLRFLLIIAAGPFLIRALLFIYRKYCSTKSPPSSSSTTTISPTTPTA